MESPSKETPSPFQKALENNQVVAQVIACDHHRIHGGLAVESDYIVSVRPTKEHVFEGFALSKTYSAFRTWTHSMEKIVKEYQTMKNSKVQQHSEECSQLVKYSQRVSHWIESQRTRYVGKVNYMYVKVLAKQRKRILDDVLDATIHAFPTAESMEKYPFVERMGSMMLTFFLTDHCTLDPEAKMFADVSTEVQQHLRKNAQEKEGGGGGGGFLNSGTDLLRKIHHDVKLDDLNPLNWIKGGSSDKDTGGSTTNTATETTVTSAGAAPRRPTLVVPLSFRERRSVLQRDMDEHDLVNIAGEEARLLLDDDRPQRELLPSYAQPVPVVRAQGGWGTFLDNTPVVFLFIAGIAMRILSRAAKIQIAVDGDIAMLLIFASFCLGLHTPRPMIGGLDRPSTMVGAVIAKRKHDKSGRRLLSRSMLQQQKQQERQNRRSQQLDTMAIESAPPPDAVTTAATETAVEDVDHEEEVSSVGSSADDLCSPLLRFPDGAPLGSHNNRWSEPDPADFEVRGPNYLTDKKKVRSGEYLFPCRGLDLFLTDTCPENVAQNPRLFGGRLREFPSFVVNFRLPWGVFVMYFEIPERFIPFVKAAYEGDAGELPSLEDMTPPERTVCRFLMNDQAYKNATLKIVPVVIDGPWVVKQVVGGKPAIIGNKLPVQYHYGPAGDGKQLYLEADLDIAASSAARGILSVTRSYTQILTLNLGFVVQGNAPDELPEQMLIGARLHGIDPLTAPSFPPMPSSPANPEHGKLLHRSNSSSSSYGDNETNSNPLVSSGGLGEGSEHARVSSGGGLQEVVS